MSIPVQGDDSDIILVDTLNHALAALRTASPPETAPAPYTRTDSEAVAWREIANRLDDAHAYAQKNNLRLGLNVWHAILDDAIRLRAALLALRDEMRAEGTLDE
jgi:hypothetical protein